MGESLETMSLKKKLRMKYHMLIWGVVTLNTRNVSISKEKRSGVG